ncbi:hypothetical protein LUZ60_005743 [Juncus effusus]|nr:hypothetical protein LUZ60_005743 [Juncus effusus]
MVSLQALVSLETKKPCFELELTVSSKKRKREEEEGEERDDVYVAKGGLEFHLESPPLPLEWERCLDIKSGQIHYYNTRTHKRTSTDPRAGQEKPKLIKPTPISDLDLELNLTCNSKEYNSKPKPRPNSNPISNSNLNLNYNLNLSDQTEMIATVCMKCHMLVMMCKLTLACPSCKFVHPQNRNPIGRVKPGFDLLCCKD